MSEYSELSIHSQHSFDQTHIFRKLSAIRGDKELKIIKYKLYDNVMQLIRILEKIKGTNKYSNDRKNNHERSE